MPFATRGRLLSAHLYNQGAASVLTCLSQLAFVPKGFKNKKRYMLSFIFHMPGNPCTLNALLHLQDIQGPKVISGAAANLAAMFQTAKRTLANWRNNFLWLQEQAEEALPWAKTMDRSFSHAFWDSIPFVANLQDADACFPSMPAMREHLRPQLLRLGFEGRGVDRSFKLQHWAYNHTFSAQHPRALNDLIARRAQSVFGIDSVDFESICRCVPGMPAHFVMPLIKTWFNAWTTSHRMHEAVALPCLFGCPAASDSLLHYVRCRRLWLAVSYATRHSSPLALDIRIGLRTATRENLLNIAVAFSEYHAIKHRELETSRSCISSRDFRPIARLTRAHAKASARVFSNILSSQRSSSGPHFVMAPTAPAIVSNTRFVQGGDHFMTTSFLSNAVAESSPVASEDFFC